MRNRRHPRLVEGDRFLVDFPPRILSRMVSMRKNSRLKVARPHLHAA